MSKCPYCARPLSGLRCRACRRFILRRAHVIFLVLATVAVAVLLLELFLRLTPTHM
jgi:hypothetical protein